jgi:serine/threonine-protein kinase HipA
MQKIEVRLDWGNEERVVGTLAYQDARIYFEFDAAFIDEPLPISPFKLPVRPGLFEHTDRDFADVFGVFNDSLPDGWGLALMDRDFRRRAINPATVSILDRLGYVGSRAMGALSYHPDARTQKDDALVIHLDDMAEQAARLQEGSAEDVIEALRIAGGSPGGARPKIVVAYRENDGRIISGASRVPADYQHYLIKFPAQYDDEDIGLIEAAYADMARAAGIDIPGTRLFHTASGKKYFGIERFDRVGTNRLHMHTLGGLFHASHRLPSLDYEGLLRGTRALTRNEAAVEEAFRRMAFNVFAHNRDDHVKNFSFLMDRSGEWRLAPAYDLVFSEGPGDEHTMAVHGEGRNPTTAHMLQLADVCDVNRKRAHDIIAQVREAVNRWVDFAGNARLAARTVDRIRRRIVAYLAIHVSAETHHAPPSLNATIGSSRDARIAGHNIATAHNTISAAPIAAYVTTSVAGTPHNIDCINRAQKYEATSPTPAPITASFNPPLMTADSTARRRAPRASRIPNSCRRCATARFVIPYTPSTLSIAACNANASISRIR